MNLLIEMLGQQAFVVTLVSICEVNSE